MKPTYYATMAVCLALAVPTATWAQTTGKPPAGGSDGAGSRTIRSLNDIPEPSTPDQLKPAEIALPTEPIEPFLITRAAGPFMVMAQTFTGPDAAKFAQLLVMELRSDYKIPAYVYYLKAKPAGSNLQDIPPTAGPEVRQANLKGQARVRAQDEAAVMVGDCKSEDECESLLKQIKKIKPRCIQTMPSYMPWRKKDLSRAIMTVNPLVPAQELFTHKEDPLVKRMNAGPYTMNNCPGPYTLQVTEFTGRAVYNLGDSVLKDEEKVLKASPLADAADDAITFAGQLAKNPEFQKLGLKPYVFHGRQGSKVTVGSFPTGNKNDPKLAALSQSLLKITLDMNVDQDKLKERAKKDTNLIQSRFIKLSKDFTKDNNLSNPIMYKPALIPIPKY